MTATVWQKMLLAAALLGLVCGCGRAAVQLQPEQVLAQMEREASQRRGQQLQLQASRTALASYTDYKVGPEDLLEMEIFGQDDLNRQVRVNGEGEVTLPLVGVVQVAGLSPKAIEQRLGELYGGRYVRDPQVTLTVKEYRHQRVSVTGAVDKPGSYELIGPRTLLEVLAMAGGLQDKGTTAKAGDVVHVIRHQGVSRETAAKRAASSPSGPPQSATLVIDLESLLSRGDTQLNIPIRNGDVIHVPFAGNAYVLGGVRRPGCVAVRDNLSLTQALAMAGGVDPVLATDQVNIMRLDSNRKPIKLTAHLNKVLSGQEEDVSLKDNDVVVVNIGGLKKNLYVFKQLMPGSSIARGYGFVP
jgi:polysaccharide export outer membrane protein